MIIRNQSEISEHIATKDDYEVFGKPKKTYAAKCRITGEMIKCNGDCLLCPYDIPRRHNGKV